MMNRKNRGEKEGKQEIIQSKDTQFDQKRLGRQQNLYLKPFQLHFTANMLKFQYFMQGFAQNICQTEFCRTHN